LPDHREKFTVTGDRVTTMTYFLAKMFSSGGLEKQEHGKRRDAMTKPTRRPAADDETGAFSYSLLELSLAAMLEDEIVRLTMASDGVSAQEVLALGEIVPLLAKEAA
jgi:hypothetical protein